MLQVKELLCGYNRKSVVGPISFGVSQGQVLCILGPNGIGKTTLFKTILKLLHPLSGQIELMGRPYQDYGAKEFARCAAYVPQGHVAPFPYRVIDVVVMGRNPNMHELSSPSKQDFRFAYDMLALMGAEKLAERDYTQLSGGERQMVMLARALAQDAKLLIMDEPTTHLDFGNELRVLGQVKKLANLGYTIVMITHAPNHAFWCGDEVLVIGKDNYYEMGKPDAVLNENTLKRLYGVDMKVEEIQVPGQKKLKVCVPLTV